MSYANWLGESTVSLPNNTIVVGGVPVNVVPIVAGTTSNKSSWSDANLYTFFSTPTLAAGTYLCGMEVSAGALTASNAGAGWNQGDFFVANIIGTAGQANVNIFVRPYTTGVQVNAASPYNKGSFVTALSGIVTLTSNAPLVWQGGFDKDSNVSYPQTRSFSITTPWYQKIA
jgi:hypothetical protein